MNISLSFNKDLLNSNNKSVKQIHKSTTKIIKQMFKLFLFEFDLLFVIGIWNFRISYPLIG